MPHHSRHRQHQSLTFFSQKKKKRSNTRNFIKNASIAAAASMLPVTQAGTVTKIMEDKTGNNFQVYADSEGTFNAIHQALIENCEITDTNRTDCQSPTVVIDTGGNGCLYQRSSSGPHSAPVPKNQLQGKNGSVELTSLQEIPYADLNSQIITQFCITDTVGPTYSNSTNCIKTNTNMVCNNYPPEDSTGGIVLASVFGGMAGLCMLSVVTYSLSKHCKRNRRYDRIPESVPAPAEQKAEAKRSEQQPTPAAQPAVNGSTLVDMEEPDLSGNTLTVRLIS